MLTLHPPHHQEYEVLVKLDEKWESDHEITLESCLVWSIILSNGILLQLGIQS